MTERSCVFCGGRDEKENLLRWVAAGGVLVPDWTQKLDGRSVYTHFDRKCLCGIYGAKKVLSSFENCTSFGVPQEKILDFVRTQAEKSFDYYFSICRRSGVLLKGQNLIAEEAGEGTVFAAIFFASDASDRTVRELEKKTGLKGVKTTLSKDFFGKKFDGRGVSVLALKPSKQSEKLMFYMNLLNNFTSGDI
ncbi:DUF448 domain-containing protein [bacterium]|nr:DUF448 domain-containing protein [bacterium]